MKNQDYIDELLGRYFAGEHMSDEQKKDLEEWIKLHSDEYDKLVQLLKKTDIVNKNRHVFNAERAWNKISPKLRESKKLNKYYIGWFAAIAASVLLVFVLGRDFIFDKNIEQLSYRNTSVKTERYLLPDSSEVILFPHSCIECLIAENEGERLVKLKGKAFFNVKRNVERKFKVVSDKVAVEVLGTSFIVDTSNKGETSVMVRTGKVRVSSGDAFVDLNVNEQVNVSDSKLKKTRIENPQETFGFESGLLIFHTKTVAGIVSEIETLTGVSIEYEEEIGKNTITAQFNLNDMDSVIEELAYLCNCSFQKTDSLHYRLYNDK